MEVNSIGKDDFIAIKFIDGDEITYERNGKKYKQDEFTKLYPDATTILTVSFIK